MIDVMEELVKGAVKDVFGTMLTITIDQDPNFAVSSTPGPHIASSVGFIGEVTGIIFIYAEDSFAKVITSRMLGMKAEEITDDEMVNDSMGELGNMVVGHIKSRLCDRGMTCVLTIPSIVRGSQFTFEAAASATRSILSFRCGDKNRVSIEVLIKPADAEQAA